MISGNIDRLLLDISRSNALWLLNFNAATPSLAGMIRYVLLCCLLLLAAPVAAQDCYADYKASRENPLQLHYGVMKVNANPCSKSDKVSATVAKRLNKAGWKLLQVRSVFDDGGLQKRKKDAGKYFLRF